MFELIADPQEEEISKLVEIIDFLEITNISLSQNIEHYPDEWSKFKKFKKMNLYESEGLSVNSLKKVLQRDRRKFQIISVEPLTAELAAFCSRDGRIDCVKLPRNPSIKIFNSRYGRRLEENSKLVEIDLNFMLTDFHPLEFRKLRTVVNSMKRCQIQYFLANHTKDPMELRSYPGLQSLGKLLNIENRASQLTNLLKRVEINNKRIEQKIPFPGVEIISDGG